MTELLGTQSAVCHSCNDDELIELLQELKQENDVDEQECKPSTSHQLEYSDSIVLKSSHLRAVV